MPNLSFENALENLPESFGTSRLWRWENKSWQPVNTETLSFGGLLYGYGCYTSFAWPLSVEKFNLHWQRLQHDTAALGLSFLPGNYLNECFEALSQCLGEEPLRVRITVAPLVENYKALLTPEPVQSQILLSASPLVLNATKAPLKPLKACLISAQRAMADIKHNSIGDSIWHKRQAMSQGYDEFIYSIPSKLLPAEKESVYLLESSFSNLFAVNVSQKKITTPDADRWPCLPGTTIQRLLSQAKKHGWNVDSHSLSVDHLAEVDLLLLCNAVLGIQALGTLDDATGNPIWKLKASEIGPLFDRLLDMMNDWLV